MAWKYRKKNKESMLSGKSEEAEKEVHVDQQVVSEEITEPVGEVNQETAETAETSEVLEVSEEVSTEEVIEEVIPPPTIDLKVSSDNQTVYVRVELAQPTQTVEPQEVIDMLKNAGISYGIDEHAIENFCTKKMFYTDLTAARGILSEDGGAGKLEYHFKIDDKINLKEQSDGTVDYKDLGLVQNVSQGDILCTATPPTDGKDGMNVFGEVIPFKKGLPATLNAGANTVLSEDKTQILAAIDGCVELKISQVLVNDVFTIKGDVDNSVGNIDSVGSVLIQGDVREGFIVKAKNDITVRGIVEGAELIAGGNITISNGMNGMNRGKLIASGNIISKYIENSTIECDGDVYADVILNSNTNAKGSVILKGRKASLIGGSCHAGTMVYANFIGSSNNVPTSITIESEELRKNMTPDVAAAQTKIEDTNSFINAKNLKISELSAQIRTLSSDLNNPNAKQELRSVMAEKNKVTEEVSVLVGKLAELHETLNKPAAFKVVALKLAYIGVKITIGYLYMAVEEDMSHTKFCVKGHSLSAIPIDSNDKLS